MITKLRTLRMGIFLLCFSMASLGLAQTTYTFTNGTASGNVGPTQPMMDAEYSGTTLDGAVTVTGGIQYWTVPVTGPYSIEAFGGQGYGDFGGRGAHIYGEFVLTAGTVLKVLVGQQAGPYLNFPSTTYNHQFGGGGGSFITDNANTPLVIAGGGGGNHGTSYFAQCDGQITEAGAAGLNASIVGAGGTGGNGGLQASSADGGGGLLSNGTGAAAGQAFINGGLGGIDEGTGGFGCGGGTSSWNNYRGGGGGGYSGGGGGNNSSNCCPAGGGGGSFNAGSNPLAFAGVQLGDGLVVITYLCTPTAGTLVADNATLSDVTADCVVSSLVAPTATNDCPGSIIEGTPDVTLPINTVGTTTVTWTYDDGVNIVTQTQDIVISGIDTDPPVIDNANLLTYSSQCAFTPPAPTATDFCAGTIYGTPDVTFPITAQGQTIVTWTYDDGSGNTVSQTQTININDVSAPTVNSPTLETYAGCNSVTPPTPTAMDNCEGAINGVPDVTFPITTAGVTTVTWTYTDANGNSSTQTQNVSVSLIDNGATASGTTLTATATGVSYQWIDCATNQPLAGVTGQAFTPSVTGNYAVVVSNAQCVDTSACLLVDYTGLTELNSDQIKIYPNPTTSGVFNVDFDGNIEQIILIDALGRTIELPTDLTTGSVDGSTLASGKYTVKVFTADAVYTKGLVIIE